MYLAARAVFHDRRELNFAVLRHLSSTSRPQKQTAYEDDDSNYERRGTAVNPLAILVHEGGRRPNDSEAL